MSHARNADRIASAFGESVVVFASETLTPSASRSSTYERLRPSPVRPFSLTDFVGSFFTVNDERAREFVRHSLEDERGSGRSSLQVSPSYERVATVDDLAARGVILEETARVCRTRQWPPVPPLSPPGGSARTRPRRPQLRRHQRHRVWQEHTYSYRDHRRPDPRFADTGSGGRDHRVPNERARELAGKSTRDVAPWIRAARRTAVSGVVGAARSLRAKRKTRRVAAGCTRRRSCSPTT